MQTQPSQAAPSLSPWQQKWAETAPVSVPKNLHAPNRYIVSDELGAAVEVALLLNQPLLLTGEPGTGKSTLANTLAASRGGDEPREPLKFVARTTTTAQDLFYIYDGLKRFLDAQTGQIKKLEDPYEYITYQALGLAILLAMPPQMRPENLEARWKDCPAQRSVVLIDEIDKAPRDFPNDILNEVERMEFLVKETGVRFPDYEEYKARLLHQKRLARKGTFAPEQAEAAEIARRADEMEVDEIIEEYRQTFESNRPILILTSNEEKELPAAFLRRCLFYHIPFPDPHTSQGMDSLREIVQARLDAQVGWDADSLNELLEVFRDVRDAAVEKQPATAELIAWAQTLKLRGIDPTQIRKPNNRATIEKLLLTVPVIAKSGKDRDAVIKKLEEYLNPQK